LTDRIIDPVEEGVDLAIRFGEAKDTSGLITRRLAEQRAMIVAAPPMPIFTPAPSASWPHSKSA